MMLSLTDLKSPVLIISKLWFADNLNLNIIFDQVFFVFLKQVLLYQHFLIITD